MSGLTYCKMESTDRVVAPFVWQNAFTDAHEIATSATSGARTHDLDFAPVKDNAIREKTGLLPS